MAQLMDLAPTKIQLRCILGSGGTISAMAKAKNPTSTNGIVIEGISPPIGITVQEYSRRKIIPILVSLRTVYLRERALFVLKMERHLSGGLELDKR